MDANKSAQTDILIVDAGLTGLMLACQLAHSRVNFRIIEKNSGPTTQSRALLPFAAYENAAGKRINIKQQVNLFQLVFEP